MLPKISARLICDDLVLQRSGTARVAVNGAIAGGWFGVGACFEWLGNRAEGYAAIGWLGAALVVWISALSLIVRRRKQQAALVPAAWHGKEIAVEFHDDRIELCAPGVQRAIPYVAIGRAEQDDDGLAFSVPGHGRLWIPVSAFPSPGEKAAAFGRLRAALEKL